MNTPSNNMPERDDMAYPEIRQIEMTPVTIGHETMFLLSDPLGISQKTVAVTAKTLYLISLFNGRNSVKDIQVKYNRKFGELIFTEKIEDIIFELDTALMLNSRKFRGYREFLVQEFKNNPVRSAQFAGDDYPENPEELRSMLDETFSKLPPDTCKAKPLGIISPHIDFDRGKVTYAHAYRQLKKSDAEIFVVFATCHREMKNFIALTDKTYSTPLGKLETHKEIIGELQKQSDTNWFEDDFFHKTEHTIEYQAVMLRYIFPEKRIRIVPILVNSLDDCGIDGKSPLDNSQVEEFITVFTELLKKQKQKAAFIAGVDFAHVGPFFGDKLAPTQLELKKLEHREKESMKFLEEADADGFFNDVVREQAKRRVCGLSPIYLMLKVMNAKRGKILDYEICSDKGRTNNVGIGAMSFY
ncbi:MAG: AmmeMemoRadiSam system protein B [Vulcanimicrobiota bacterium]